MRTRIPMIMVPMPRLRRRRVWILLAACLFGSTTPLAMAKTQAQSQPQAIHPASRRAVRAVLANTPGADAQTSWLIEPVVPRIPDVAGLHTQLPPHIDRRLSYAFDLAQRGALYSAENEFKAVLGLCALEADARSGGTSHRESFRQGWVALEEADQFGGHGIGWRDSADVRRLAAEHATPVLAELESPVDNIQTVQAYYAFAEKRLIYACQELPGASLAYYGLARTYTARGSGPTHAGAKAALLQRVALAIAPQNALAANELGVLLAQHGQFEEAERVLKQCIAIDPSPEAWRNLALVRAHQGDQEAYNSAMARSEALDRQQRKEADNQDTTLSSEINVTQAHEAGDENQKPGLLDKLNITSRLPNLLRP